MQLLLHVVLHKTSSREIEIEIADVGGIQMMTFHYSFSFSTFVAFPQPDDASPATGMSSHRRTKSFFLIQPSLKRSHCELKKHNQNIFVS